MQKHFVGFLFIFSLISISLNAQYNFLKEIGGIHDDIISSAVQTADNGIVAAGATLSYGAGFVDALVIKLDSAGNTEWNFTYGKSNFDRAISVIQLQNGNYFVTGSCKDSGSADENILLMKLDNSGTLLWSKTYGTTGTDIPSPLDGLQQTTDGGFVVAGISDFLNNSYSIDAYILRLDSLGDTLWTRGFRGTFSDQAFSVKQTFDGGFIISGRTNSFGNNVMDAMLIKLDSTGNTQWMKRFAGVFWDEGQAVKQAADSGYIVAGATTSGGAGDYDMMAFKTDGSGNLQWAKTIGGFTVDAGTSVVQCADGNFAVAGYLQSYNAARLAFPNTINGNDSTDVFLVKLNQQGDTLWCSAFGGEFLDEAYSLSNASDGGLIMTVYSLSYGDSMQGLLIKTDSMGMLPCYNSRIYPVVTNLLLAEDTISFVPASGFVQGIYTPVQLPVIAADSIQCTTFTTNSNEKENESGIKIYPNPFSDIISFYSPEQEGLVKIFDLTGIEVLSMPLSKGQNNIAVNRIASGVYILKHGSVVLKLIKQ